MRPLSGGFEDRTVLLTTTPLITSMTPDESAPGGLDGAIIGHYQVQDMIGRGSFGEVYRAFDPRLDREVAIKVAGPGIADDPNSRDMFWNEARIQARLEHSNIVPIYDILEESGRLALVMRLIHGADLDQRLKQMVRPFTASETLRMMRQVSAAVGSAHDRGVVHQDLKPGNIRLTPNAEAVVMDFGVARISGQVAPGQIGATGTPSYMSPEQIRGEPIDARADIYALAMTLYKTLTGHHPFEEASDVGQLLAWQVEREPPSPTRYNPHIPPALADAILRGLAKDPRQRYRACADFVLAVSAALGLDEAVPVSDDNGRWNPRAAVSLAAQVLQPGAEPLDARVIDLSTTGAGLKLATPLTPGARLGLVIRIPLKNSEHTVRCAMRVLRMTRGDDGQSMRAGVAFEALGEFDRAVLADLVRAVLVFNATG